MAHDAGDAAVRHVPTDIYEHCTRVVAGFQILDTIRRFDFVWQAYAVNERIKIARHNCGTCDLKKIGQNIGGDCVAI